MKKTKSELIEYVLNPGALNNDELKKLYYHIFGIKAHPNPLVSYRYLMQHAKYPWIYKTRFNK